MTSILNNIDEETPPLTQAVKLTQVVSKVGFDWPNIHGVMAKVEKEVAELFEEIESNADQHRIKDELGDLLFACCNLARHLNIDPNEALQGTNDKFTQRFQFVEQQVSLTGKSILDCDLDTLDAYWEQAKKQEK
jgi:MazG family protein